MAANGFITTAELNFDTYKANLKQYLSSQSIFNDYNFEGSNFSVLLDVLAYNTYLNAFYLNMVGSEMFLDTAQLPESVYSHAKELNYTPSSRSSSKAIVTLTLPSNKTTNTASYLQIPKNYRISAVLDGKTYIFSTNESLTISRTGTTGFTSANVEVYEGKVATEYFTQANTSSTATRYILSSSNVDISSVDVKIRSSVSTPATLLYPYNRSYTLYGLTSTSNNYFIQSYGKDKYEIVFGNGITGRSLTPGNIVQVLYRDASGDMADNATTFTALDNFTNNLGATIPASSLSVGTVQNSTGGSERESISSIKFNAPRYYTTQDRAVTKEDYVSLIKINFPSIQAVSVYGGEDASPKQYGKVIIVLRPYGSEVAPTLTKEAIKNYLRDRMSLSITPLFQDPDFFYAKITSTVYYNPAVTALQDSDIRSSALSAISKFTTQNLENFNSNLRYSKLVAAIDSADTSILSNDTYLLMIKRIVPALNTAYSTVINYNNQLDTTFKLSTGFAATPVITSSLFYSSISGVSTQCYLEDDGAGVVNLRSGTYISPVGTVDYTSGTVIISNLTVTNYTSYISIYARTSLEDIYSTGNQILEIDAADVSITIATATN
jgi:hypothetical protein